MGIGRVRGEEIKFNCPRVGTAVTVLKRFRHIRSAGPSRIMVQLKSRCYRWDCRFRHSPQCPLEARGTK